MIFKKHFWHLKFDISQFNHKVYYESLTMFKWINYNIDWHKIIISLRVRNSFCSILKVNVNFKYELMTFDFQNENSKVLRFTVLQVLFGFRNISHLFCRLLFFFFSINFPLDDFQMFRPTLDQTDTFHIRLEKFFYRKKTTQTELVMNLILILNEIKRELWDDVNLKSWRVEGGRRLQK